MGPGRVERVLQKKEKSLCKGEGVKDKMVPMTVGGRVGCRQKRGEEEQKKEMGVTT